MLWALYHFPPLIHMKYQDQASAVRMQSHRSCDTQEELDILYL